MKIFFAFSTYKLSIYINNYKELVDIILNGKNKLTVNLIAKSLNEKKSQNESLNTKEKEIKFYKDAIEGIKDADMVIAEISLPSSGVGFQIGYALSIKKPVLCMYSTEFGNKKPPKVIAAIKSPYLKIHSYTQATAKVLLDKTLSTKPKNALVKFNFIISEEINDYLKWLHTKTSKSKSEVLREVIYNKIISNDKAYLFEKRKVL